MRRVFAVLLALIFLTSLFFIAGCAEKETPKPVEKEAVEKEAIEEKEEVKEEEEEIEVKEEKEEKQEETEE